MARVLLGITGSVAAVRAPALFAAIRDAGHSTRAIATGPSLHFFDPSAIDPLSLDGDEWPPGGYQRGDSVLHIELRNWADLLVVAPLDAHTLGKFALGVSDNLLSCVLRAWDFSKPLILAPAMNTMMWESPITRRHLAIILEDRGDGRLGGRSWTLAEADRLFAEHAPGIVLIPPQSKRLACGDVGIGAMAEIAAIAEAVRRFQDLPGPA